MFYCVLRVHSHTFFYIMFASPTKKRSNENLYMNSDLLVGVVTVEKKQKKGNECDEEDSKCSESTHESEQKCIFIDENKIGGNRLPYPERVAAMQHQVEKLRKQNIHLRSDLMKLTEAFKTHTTNCVKHHVSSRTFFDTKVRTYVQTQINTMMNWTIDKVVEMKKEGIGVEERLMLCWRQTNDIILKVDKEKEDERLMALDLKFVDNKESK